MNVPSFDGDMLSRSFDLLELRPPLILRDEIHPPSVEVEGSRDDLRVGGRPSSVAASSRRRRGEKKEERHKKRREEHGERRREWEVGVGWS